MSRGWESAPCDQCGEESIIRRGSTPACRMTPGCAGHHKPALSEALRRPDIAPTHRVDDGPTARTAARHQTPHRLSETRERVLRALLVHGALTDHAIADATELHPGSASKRRGELVKMGLVREHGRSLSPSGVPAATWALTADGIATLDMLRRRRRAS